MTHVNLEKPRNKECANIERQHRRRNERELTGFIPNLKEVVNGVVCHEQWRDIYGYDGIYQISDFGRVKSFFANINKTHGRLLKPRPDADGYGIVELYKDKISRPFKVHRLVAQYFLPNPEHKPEVNHIGKNSSGIIDKAYNEFYNIEWATREENELHKNLNGMGKQGLKHHNVRLSEEDVYYIRASKEPRKILAEKYGVGVQQITNIRGFKTWKHLPKK